MIHIKLINKNILDIERIQGDSIFLISKIFNKKLRINIAIYFKWILISKSLPQEANIFESFSRNLTHFITLS